MATGDLVVKVVSDTSNYSSGLRKAAQDARSFQTEAERAGRRAGFNSGLALEAGRLAEDLSIGYQINGLRGALQGAGNNITQMASIVSPLAGGIAGLAVAGIGIAPMLYSWATAAKDASAEFTKLKDETDALRAAADERIKDRAAARQRMGFGGLDHAGVKRESEVARSELVDIRERMQLQRDFITSTARKGGRYNFEFTPGSGLTPDSRNVPDPVWVREWMSGVLDPNGFDGKSAFTEEEITSAVDAARELQKLGREADRLKSALSALEKREKSAASEDMAKKKAEWAKDKERFDRDTAQRAQRFRDQMSGIVDDTRTPDERFRKAQEEAAALRRNAFFYGVPVDENAMMRKQGQELRRLAESRGLLGPSPGMAGGALRGSADDYRARINTSGKDPSTLLEKQIKAVEEGNATQEDVKRIMQAISDRLGEPVPVVEI